MSSNKDPLEELALFLNEDSRLDIKIISLNHLVGLSGSQEGINTLLSTNDILAKVVELTEDKSDEISKNALVILVNVTATENGAKAILKCRPSNHKNILKLLVSYVLNSEKKNADAACMILSNITRLEDELEMCIETLLPHLNDILNVFVNVDFNKKNSKLHYLAPMFSNLSRSKIIQNWFIEEHPHVPLIKLLPFCNYQESVIRRGGAVGTLRNLSFSTEYHDFLLKPDLDLLTYILSPLMGNEDYPDDEMDVLPVTLQYQPKEKNRESDNDIRKMLLEILNRFCTKRQGREVLRNNGVYYILREYHKWEKDAKVLLACENVVDILIRKEDEIGVEDLTSVEVTDDMKVKFDKMDQDFVNT